MATLQPTFSLTIGSLASSTDNLVAGPQTLVVERDMDIPADALHLRLTDRTDVALGDEVTLALGHDGEEEHVFTGVVVRIQPTLSGIAVSALGRMNDLLNVRTAATFEDQTAGSIARDLIDQAGLDADTIEEGPTLPRFAVDKRVSAFAHLKGLADRLGFELYANRDGAVRFHALGDAAGLDAAGGALGAVADVATGLLGGGAEQYQFGKHLIRARTHRLPTAWGRIDIGGESPMSGQGDTTAHWLTINDADYRGSAGTDDPSLLLLDPAARTKDLADRFAAGRLAVARRTAHQVAFTVLGRPQVELGDTLSVGDVPEALHNGEGYVRAIRHRFGSDVGFVTEFRIAMGVPA